jgi:hypothetical protein
MTMTKIILSRSEQEGHWQITYDGAGPYLIGSTLEVPAEIVIRRIQLNNPHAQVMLEANDEV